MYDIHFDNGDRADPEMFSDTAEARDAAIGWNLSIASEPMFWSEATDWGDFWEAVADRFPELRDEFRENGLI